MLKRGETRNEGVIISNLMVRLVFLLLRMTKGFNNIIGAILEKSLGFPLKEPNLIFLFSPWTRGGAIVGGGDSPSSRSRSPRSRDEEENHQGIG